MSPKTLLFFPSNGSNNHTSCLVCLIQNWKFQNFSLPIILNNQSLTFYLILRKLIQKRKKIKIHSHVFGAFFRDKSEISFLPRCTDRYIVQDQFLLPSIFPYTAKATFNEEEMSMHPLYKFQSLIACEAASLTTP